MPLVVLTPLKGSAVAKLVTKSGHTAPLKAELMSETQIEWLNAYHVQVCERLSPLLSTSECEWLESKTQLFPR